MTIILWKSRVHRFQLLSRCDPSPSLVTWSPRSIIIICRLALALQINGEGGQRSRGRGDNEREHDSCLVHKVEPLMDIPIVNGAVRRLLEGYAGLLDHLASDQVVVMCMRARDHSPHLPPPDTLSISPVSPFGVLMKSPPILRLVKSNIFTHGFSAIPRPALYKDLSLTIESDEAWCIVGGVGCGKSTFVNTLLGRNRVEPKGALEHPFLEQLDKVDRFGRQREIDNIVSTYRGWKVRG